MSKLSGTVFFAVGFRIDNEEFTATGEADHFEGYVTELTISHSTRTGQTFNPYAYAPESPFRIAFKKELLKAIDYLLPNFS